MIDDPIYEIKDLPDILHLSRSSIFGLFRSGQLESITQGGRRYVTEAQINDYIEARKAAARKADQGVAAE